MPTLPVKDSHLLIELQEKDHAIDRIRLKIDDVPKRIVVIKADFEEKKKSAAEAKAVINNLLVLKKQKELDAAAHDELIKKHQKELNQIKSNDAFKALLAEIEKAKSEKDETETRILQTLDEIDEAVKAEKIIQGQLRSEESGMNVEINNLEKIKADSERELAQMEASRAEFAAGINADAVVRYEFIRKQRKGTAVVPVKMKDKSSASCGGCNMALPPQALVDLKKKDVATICDTCQRIIFDPAVFAQGKAAA